MRIEEKTFQQLVNRYNVAIKYYEGKGDAGQKVVSAAYQQLERYIVKHPEFKGQLPPLIHVYDDNCNGMLVGIREIWRKRLL